MHALADILIYAASPDYFHAYRSADDGCAPYPLFCLAYLYQIVIHCQNLLLFLYFRFYLLFSDRYNDKNHLHSRQKQNHTISQKCIAEMW